MAEDRTWEVLYATPSNTTTIKQTTLDDDPPKGFEGGVCLLPLVQPEDARIERTPWLITDWLRLEGTTILSGQYKSLKSFFARQLALSVTSGLPFLGVHEVFKGAKRKPVVIVCAEEKYNDVIHALHRAATGLGIGPEQYDALPIKVWPALGASLFSKNRSGKVSPTRQYNALVAACEEVRPAMVMLDPLVELKGNASENLADDMRPVFTWFRMAGERIGATVLILDHEGHPEAAGAFGGSRPTGRPRGSSDKVGSVDDAISLSITSDEKNGLYVVGARLLHRGAGSSKHRVTVHFDDPEGPITFTGPNSPVSAASIDAGGKQLISAVLAGAGESKRQLQNALGLKSPEQLKTLLDRFSELVEITSEGKGKPSTVSLSQKGHDLAVELGLEVRNAPSAQNEKE